MMSHSLPESSSTVNHSASQPINSRVWFVYITAYTLDSFCLVLTITRIIVAVAVAAAAAAAVLNCHDVTMQEACIAR